MIETTMYGIPDPPTSGAYQAPMPTDHAPNWPPPLRVTVVDGGITYTEGPSAYDVLLQQAQTIEGLRKMVADKDNELTQLRGRLYTLAAEKRGIEEALAQIAREKKS